MAWGKAKIEAKPSVIRQLLPLVIFLLFAGGIAFVLYQVYVGAGKVRQTASDRMARKNVVFTRDGMKVGVKHVENEKYVDATQSWVVKAWNMGGNSSSTPQTKRK
ncbi:hypothetical protein F4780DRAFT_776905 [Xylariomycetidae sp. FL0641]|nr:hypothetical protein F4780DRAFT_776905 [Xylariomycetidae sp. FL0641]